MCRVVLNLLSTSFQTSSRAPHGYKLSRLLRLSSLDNQSEHTREALEKMKVTVMRAAGSLRDRGDINSKMHNFNFIHVVYADEMCINKALCDYYAL